MNRKVISIFFKCIVFILSIIIIFFFNGPYQDMIKFNENEEKNDLSSFINYFEKLANDENEYYYDIIHKHYEDRFFQPYIPDGFTLVEGEWNTGLVIQDENENQFVWVPCCNSEKVGNVPRLEKRDFVDNAFISYKDCYDENYEEFLKSTVENGGFYISRYEIGKEEDVPVSKSNKEIWKDVTREEAKIISENMYNNINIRSELINGYAHDITLQWIKNNNNIEKFIIDTKNNYHTGRNEYNKIFDFTDNILELTTENNLDTIIVRGFSSISSNELTENNWRDENRYAILENFRSMQSSKDGLAFRVIIYRN